jgi:hypothetical protein
MQYDELEPWHAHLVVAFFTMVLVVVVVTEVLEE